MNFVRPALALGALLALAACAKQAASAVAPAEPGFLYGLWHGFIFPVAWVLSLFMDDVAIYAVPNNGGCTISAIFWASPSSASAPARATWSIATAW